MEAESQSSFGIQQVTGSLVSFAKLVWQLLDVATLMVRLLYNTLVHDTHHGSEGLGDART